MGGRGKALMNDLPEGRPLAIDATARSASLSEPAFVAPLRGHLKSGQWWSLQNRPTERGLGQGCFTPSPPGEASLFLCANSVDRI